MQIPTESLDFGMHTHPSEHTDIIIRMLTETHIHMFGVGKKRKPIRNVEVLAFGALPIQNMYVFIGIYSSLDESIYVNSIQMWNEIAKNHRNVFARSLF